MGLIEILIGVVFTLAVGVGVAMTTSATTGAEFWVARGCFGIAGAALLVAYVFWVWSGPRDPSWRVLAGAIVGVLVVAGTTETILWVNFRQQQSDAQKVSQETAQLAPVIQALRDAQDNLRNQEAANAIVGLILQQYDQLIAGVSTFEQFRGAPDEKDRLASAQHTIESLKILLSGVQVVATRMGNGLVIKTAPNTFRVTFPVPTRIPPNITCHALPGVTMTELEKTNIGVTLIFTPMTILINTLPPCEFSAEL
jgi:hypothetical protein